MEDKRNPMQLDEVNIGTPFEIEFTHKASAWYATKTGFRPTSAYVVALKPCGCTGPTLGSVETVQLPKVKPVDTYNPPRTWKPAEHGYTLIEEAKGRVGLYLNGERLFGKLIYGGDSAKMLRLLSYRHHLRTVLEADRPRYPDGRMHAIAKDAMGRQPHAQCKLWAVYPDRPYRYDRRSKPVGYVWGKEAAAKALHAWWVKKNMEQDRTYVAVSAAA